MARPIIAPSSAILTPAIDAIVALRPEALAHFNAGGRWADLPAMWRGQVLLDLARLADEAMSARLRFSKGDALRTLCASEFGTSLPTAPQTGIGEVVLARPDPYPAVAPQGVIKKGTTFGKAANPNAIPLPIAAASYVSTRPVFVPKYDGSDPNAEAYGSLDGITIPVEAVNAGADANVPTFTNYASPTSIQPGQPLFDSTFTVTGCACAGGSSGLTDPGLVAAARAYAQGQFGSTQGALIAGLLQQQSVRHYAVFPAGTLPYSQFYVTDESWSTSQAFANLISQAIADTWQGFGCRSRAVYIQNTHIAAACTIILKSTDDLNDTDDIDANVRQVAESYFNDRPDWYRFRAAHLQALLAKADQRILHCSSVAITDAVTGASIPDPANAFGQSGTLVHWYLVDQNVTTTYQPPS